MRLGTCTHRTVFPHSLCATHCYYLSCGRGNKSWRQSGDSFKGRSFSELRCLDLTVGILLPSQAFGLHSRACRGKLKSGFAGQDNLPFLSVFPGEHPLSNLCSATCLSALAPSATPWLADWRHPLLSLGFVFFLFSQPIDQKCPKKSLCVTKRTTMKGFFFLKTFQIRMGV